MCWKNAPFHKMCFALMYIRYVPQVTLHVLSYTWYAVFTFSYGGSPIHHSHMFVLNIMHVIFWNWYLCCWHIFNESSPLLGHPDKTVFLDAIVYISMVHPAIYSFLCYALLYCHCDYILMYMYMQIGCIIVDNIKIQVLFL